MKTLIALLLLSVSASAQQFDWAITDDAPFSWSTTEKGGDLDLAADDPQSLGTDVTGSGAVQDSETAALESFVHRINVANRGGSGTLIAPGVLVTCKHIFEGLSGYQVSIDGQAVAASVTLAPAHDVAIVRLGSEAAAAPFSADAPAYMSECLAFGFGSETLHRGVISNDGTLSLYADQGDIEQGDSGGAVFCDGKLIGVIRGKNPGNGKVCYFTPLSAVASLVAPFSPAGGSYPNPPGAGKPSITIVSPATWDCQYCPGHRAQDWSDFNVTFEQRDGLPSYPCTEWTDNRGVIRRLYGKRTPSQVMWSYRETMR